MRYICSNHEKCKESNCHGQQFLSLKDTCVGFKALYGFFCCFGKTEVYPVQEFTIELPEELFEL